MNKLILVALTWVTVNCSTPAFCQANWTYHIGFVLNGKDGQALHRHDIGTRNYRIFIGNQSPNEELNCVVELGLFYVTGTAAYPGVSIGLTNGSDSTVVILPSGRERTILTNWPTEPGIYNLELEDETNRIKHPEAILCYPTQFRMDDKRLFSLTVLDWSKYRTNPTDYDGNLKAYFQHEVKTQRDK